MQTYLVGGAVRDSLLGLDVTERDFVVVGSTEAKMRAAGYRSVGKDFPVFLHPHSQEEYALARTERKVAPGHQGFICHASPDVTLEEDLLRRDLTINAIAQADDGSLIDPYHGADDLKLRLLKHVSDAFAEDPLRILRLARFKAKFHHLGFKIHADTERLVTSMVKSNALDELAPERILAELDKALLTPDPHEFFSSLQAFGAQPMLWQEIQTAGLQRLETRSDIKDTESRFALLLFDQPTENIKQLCDRLKTTKRRRELSVLVATHFDTWAGLRELNADRIAALITATDGLRKADRFSEFNRICSDIEGVRSDTALYWQQLRDAMASIKARDLATDLTGKALGDFVLQTQINQIEQLLEKPMKTDL